MKIDKRFKLTFFFLLLFIGLPSVAILSIPQNNGFVYSFHYDSQSLFNPYINLFNPPVSTDAITTYYPFTIYNTSVFDLTSWYSNASFPYNLLELDFNSQFTHLTSVEHYNLDYLGAYISSIKQIVTNGQEFFVLGYNSSIHDNGASSEIIVMNKTFTVLQTIPIPCFSDINSTPYTGCGLIDMKFWNNSLWFLKHYFNSSLTESVLSEYNISSFKLEHQYFLPTSVSSYGTVTRIVPVNNKTLWLLSPFSLVNRFPVYYDFDLNTGVLVKMMEGGVAYYYPLLDYYPLLISTVKALVFMGDFSNSYQLDGTLLFSIVALPVLSLQPILINASIFIAIITCIVWFTEIKVLIRRIGTYLDSKLFC